MRSRLSLLTRYLGLPFMLLWSAAVWIYLFVIHVPDPEDFDPLFLGHPTEILSVLWLISVVIYAGVVAVVLFLRLVAGLWSLARE